MKNLVVFQVLGRLASRIATVLQGKDKPTYTPNREDGDMCIVLNAKDIGVTGRKMTHKFYRWHTGQVNYFSFSLCIAAFMRQNSKRQKG